MSDKLISELVEKTGVVDSDQLAVEGAGGTWKITLLKLREYLFGIFPLFTGSTTKNDFLIVKKFEDGSVYRMPFDSVLPDSLVQTRHLEDSVSASTGVVESKIAPAAVTHSKLAINAVHTHNIANAEGVNVSNWASKDFGTGVTTDKIVDGAVTGAKGGVPVGAVFHFAGVAAPVGYLACDGGVIPAYNSANPGATFANVPVWRLQDLRTFLGANFGAVGKLPDLRGVFIRGLGQNATKTVRTFVKSYTTASITRDASTFESNAARADTVSYVVEFYSDTNHLTLIEEKTVTPTGTFAEVAGRYARVYANKGAASAALGTFQGDAMQQHYHGTSDPGHAHGLSGGGTSGNYVTNVREEPANNTTASGHNRRVKRVYTDFGNVTYQHPAVLSEATGITVARHPATLPWASVDETRPVNTGLLACIKY